MEEAALNLPQGKTPVSPIPPGSRHDRPVTLEAVVEAKMVGVAGAKDSEGSLVDQEGQADQGGLEAATRTQKVIRRPEFHAGS